MIAKKSLNIQKQSGHKPRVHFVRVFKELVDSLEKGKDALASMKLHNNEIGRVVSIRNLPFHKGPACVTSFVMGRPGNESNTGVVVTLDA